MTADPSLLESVARAVTARLGLDFPPGRRDVLARGMGAVASSLGEPDPAALTARLATGEWTAEEEALVARALTIRETYFCRERPTLRALRDHALRALIEARRKEGVFRLRCWSAGCATGEEAWSLALLLDRLLPDRACWIVEILGTDIDEEALAVARAGRYGPWSFRNMPGGILGRQLLPVGDGRFAPAAHLARWARFERHNLVLDPVPPGGVPFDLVLCRNLLMYFAPEQARDVLDRLCPAVAPDGWFATGIAEVPLACTGPFDPVRLGGATLFRRPGPRPSEPAPAAPPRATHAPPRPARPRPRRERPSPPAPAPEGIDPAAAARALADRGDAAGALAAVERAIATAPLDPALHYLRGLLLEDTGDHDGAVRAHERALYADPKFVICHYTLGLLARRLGRDRLARRHLGCAAALAAALDPDLPLPGGEGLTAGRVSAELRRVGAGGDDP